MPEREQGVYDSIEVKLDKGADYDSAFKEIERKLRLSRKVIEDTRTSILILRKKQLRAPES